MAYRIIWVLLLIATVACASSVKDVNFQPLGTQSKRSLNSQMEDYKKASIDGSARKMSKVSLRQNRQVTPSTTTTENPFTGIFGGGTTPDISGLLGNASSGFVTLAGLPLMKGLVKASLIAVPFTIKEIILRPIILVALLLFLLTGAAYFACNVVNCQKLISGLDGIGDIGGSFGGGLGHGHGSTNTYGQRSDELQPILRALENGYNKYK